MSPEIIDIQKIGVKTQSVNRSLGKQINNFLKDLPDNTKIDKVTIDD